MYYRVPMTTLLRAFPFSQDVLGGPNFSTLVISANFLDNLSVNNLMAMDKRQSTRLNTHAMGLM